MFKLAALCALLVVVAARPEEPATSDLPRSYERAHVIQKRAFGVLENAGLGAAAAAVNTFAGSIISANQASAVAANPLNNGQNYPSQSSNYPNQQNHGQNNPSSNLHQGQL